MCNVRSRERTVVGRTSFINAGLKASMDGPVNERDSIPRALPPPFSRVPLPFFRSFVIVATIYSHSIGRLHREHDADARQEFHGAGASRTTFLEKNLRVPRARPTDRPLDFVTASPLTGRSSIESTGIDADTSCSIAEGLAKRKFAWLCASTAFARSRSQALHVRCF